MDMDNIAELEEILASCKAGDKIQLTIFRNGLFYSVDLPVKNRR